MTANNDALREALERILEVPKDTMSDGKALREIVKIAREALAAGKPELEQKPGVRNCTFENRRDIGITMTLEASKPEPQAQAGEPEGMKFCLVLPEPPKAKNFRRQQRRDGGYNMVPAYTEEELCAYGEICCADIQQQLDAMRHARDLYKAEADAIEALRREAIAKKDAALHALSSAAKEATGYLRSGKVAPSIADKIDAAIAQGLEALE